LAGDEVAVLAHSFKYMSGGLQEVTSIAICLGARSHRGGEQLRRPSLGNLAWKAEAVDSVR
jgi:hypothetical protein